MLFTCILTSCAQPLSFAEEEDSRKEVEVFSEYLGYVLGEDLTGHFKECYNIDAIVRGIRKFEQGLAPKGDYIERITEMQKRFYNIKAEDNMRKANEFLSNLSKNEDVISLEKGKLLYEEITQGKGKAITDRDEFVAIRHSVRVFDEEDTINTFKNEKPVSINLAETIAGFAKGVVGMKVGGKRRLYIHPDLAYKTAGLVPPNSLLIIEVEIVS